MPDDGKALPGCLRFHPGCCYHLSHWCLTGAGNVSIVVNVSGGRDNDDWRSLYATLDALHKEHGIAKIRHGACKKKKNGEWALSGTDKWAEQWALENELPFSGYPARWNGVGHKGAGHIRNKLMGTLVPKADYWVVAEGGAGTASAAATAIACGIELVRVIPLSANPSV